MSETDQKKTEVEAAESAENEALESAAEESAEAQEEEKDIVPYELLGLENKENCEAEIKVKVSWEDFQERSNDIFDDLKKNAVVDGFRKGKVPLPLLKARFREDVRSDVINGIIPNIMEQIEADKEITFASEAVLTDKKVEEGQPVELTITVEVFPTVELSDEDIKGLEVEVEEVKVADDDVEKMIDSQRMQASVVEPADESAAFDKGLLISGKVSQVDPDGKVVAGSEQETTIDGDSPQLEDEIFKLLKGKKTGDTVLIPRKGEDGKFDESLGKIQLVIDGLKKRVKPELDDEFAKDLGFDDLAAYRADTLARLEKSKKSEVEHKAITSIVEQISKKKNIEAPSTAVEEMARRDLVRYFGQMKASREEAETLLESLRKSSEMTIKRQVILKAFKERFDIDVTDEDVDKKIEEMAEAEGRKPLAIRARLEAEKRLDALKDELLMETVTKRILDEATKE